MEIVPFWLSEGEVVAAEMRRRVDGAPPRDLGVYSAWRTTAREDNLDLLQFYEEYHLFSQFSGMSDAISIDGIRIALEIENVPRKFWPYLTKRILRLHGHVMKATKKRKEK